MSQSLASVPGTCRILVQHQLPFSSGHFSVRRSLWARTAPLGIEAASTCKLPPLKEWLEERKLMQHVLSQHFHRARTIMKAQADKKRTERTFSVGDSVFVKLQPYVQVSVARRSNHKLSFRYY